MSFAGRRKFLKPLLLMKDYSVKKSDAIEKYYDEIQFILFPCDPELNTYTLFEPNKYMVKMKKAKIILESVAERCGYDYRDHYHPIGRIEKIVYSYTELVQYIFSIDKMKMYNAVMQMSDISDIPPYIKVMFCFFSVRIYDKNNKVIFKKKININEETKLAEIHISKIFGAGNILNNIRDIYFQELSLFKDYISIDPINEKWDLNCDTYVYNLCGMWLDETNSITFFHKYDLNKIEKVTTLYGAGNVFPKDTKSQDVVLWNIPEYDVLYVEPQLIVEYITYLPYINLVMKTCTKVSNVRPGKEIVDEEDLKVLCRLEIEIDGVVKTRRFTDNDPFTISDLLDLLEGDM